MPEVSTVPGVLDLGVYAGDANVVSFEVVNDGDPVDLTGAVVTAQCRKTAADPVVGMSATVSVAGIGLLSVGWDGEQVRALLAGEETWRGVWDLQILFPEADLPVTPLAGRWTARMDVTRDA